MMLISVMRVSTYNGKCIHDAFICDACVYDTWIYDARINIHL